MEEINLDLESVPHNSVDVSVEPLGGAPPSVNVQKDTSIGLELLMNKSKMSSAEPVRQVSMNSVSHAPRLTPYPQVVETQSETKTIDLSPPSSPNLSARPSTGTQGGQSAVEEIDLDKLLGEDLGPSLTTTSEPMNSFSAPKPSSPSPPKRRSISPSSSFDSSASFS